MIVNALLFATAGVIFIDEYSGDIQLVVRNNVINNQGEDYIFENWAIKRAFEVGPERFWNIVNYRYLHIVYIVKALFIISILLFMVSITAELNLLNSFLKKNIKE
jgi:hypothetical protein